MLRKDLCLLIYIYCLFVVGPHIDINPPQRTTLDDSMMSMSAFNKSRSEYMQTLQRNYFV